MAAMPWPAGRNPVIIRVDSAGTMNAVRFRQRQTGLPRAWGAGAPRVVEAFARP